MGTARKKFSCSQLTLGEKIEIAHSAVVKMEAYGDIANKFNVKPMLVSYTKF